MNRAESIRNYLAGRTKPATIGEIQIGLDELRQAEGLDHEAFARRIGAQVAQMTKAGKLKRTGLLGSYAYALAADGRRDRRARPPSPRTAERKRRKADRAAARAAAPAPVPAPAKPRPLDQSLRTPPTRQCRSAREQLAADVAAFIKAGGRIQRLANGESSQPLLHTRREIEARPGRLGKRRIHDEEPDDLDVAA